MKKLLAYTMILAVLALLSVADAQPLPRDDGSGEIIELEPFTKITLSGDLNAVVTLGEQYTCRFAGPENLVRHMSAKVKNDTLKLREKPNLHIDFTSDERAIAYVTVPHISALTVAGVGDINFEGVQQQSLHVIVAGAGNITLIGYAPQLKIEVAGSGDVRAEHFSAGATSVEITGTGNVEIANIIESLAIEVMAAGKVEADYLKVKKLSVEIKAAGDVSLNGRADQAQIKVTAAGSVRGRDLNAREASVDVWGSGSVSLGVAESLHASIIGSGDVVYYGSPPEVEQKVIGTGQVRQGV